MKKRQSKKRGDLFAVSMVVLGIIAFFLVISMLGKLEVGFNPSQREARKLCKEAVALIEQNTHLSEEQITALQDPDALAAYEQKLYEKLADLFAPNSENLAQAVRFVHADTLNQLKNKDLIISRKENPGSTSITVLDGTKVMHTGSESPKVVEDGTAKVTAQITYDTVYKPWNQVTNERYTDREQIIQRLVLKGDCAKIGDEWKFRSFTYDWYVDFQ